MMRATQQRTLGAVAAGLMMMRAATAADATAEGAGQVKTALEHYLGTGALTVTPAGAGYKVDIDIKTVLQGLERFGFSLSPAIYTLTATPDSDGVWHVTSGGLPPLSLKRGDQTTSIVSNGQSFDGRFDTKIPSFTSWTGRYDSISIGMIGKGATTQARELVQGEQTFSASPHGDGVVDGTLTRTDAGFSQDIAVDDPKAHLDISIKSGRTNDVAAMFGLHVRALADLWAFFVAHPSIEAVKADQPALRTLLRQALPVFDRVTQDGTLEGLSVRSPVGPIGAQKFAAHFDLHGLTADGGAGLSLKAEGLTIPTDRLPPWSSAFVPTGVELQAALSGYRLDEAAKTIVDEFDLTAPKPLSQATLDKLPALIGPRDQMLVTIGDSRLTSSTLDARFSGAIHLTQPMPEVAVTVHATGLDRAIAAVQEQARQDASAAKAIAMLILIKGYGKAEPDGATTWIVASDRSGTVTINGVPLPGARKN